MARSSVAPSVLLTAWPQLCFLRHNTRVARIAAVLLVIVLGVAAAAAPGPASRTVILSTTTSTQDAGLLDVLVPIFERQTGLTLDRKSTRLNSSHGYISYAVFCLKKKKNIHNQA